MSDQTSCEKIPEEVLAEHWFAFIQRVIGELQSAFRKEHKTSGLTQKDIAIRIGKDTGFVSRCLGGQQNMTMRTLHNIARGMNYRLDIVLRPLGDVRNTNRVAHLDASGGYEFQGSASNSNYIRPADAPSAG